MPLRPSAIAQVTPAVDRVLPLALAKSRDARIASASELATVFASAQGEQPWSEPVT